MVDRGVYTLRGWLAFVAFLDFAQCLRSHYDKDAFLGTRLCPNPPANCSESQKESVPAVAARLLLAYSFQNGMILVLCAFCIHHWPMILTAALSILMKVAYLFAETLKFRSAPFDFHIIFPLVVHVVTFIALLFSRKLLAKEVLEGEENEEIVKKKCVDGKPLYVPPRKPNKSATSNKTDKMKKSL